LRIVRFAADSKPRYGILDGSAVRGLQRSPFASFRNGQYHPNFDGSRYRLNEVRLLAPCTPSKMICLGVNYRSHAMETGLAIPPVPLIFLKPSTAVIGPEDKIVLPRLDKRRVDYEAELGIVIGRRTKDMPRERAKECVLGYTCFNDVSERYAQKSDGQWTRCKGYDTFAPIGPWIETEVNPDDLKVESYLNGEVRQSARTSDLIFGIAEIVSFISGIMTLLPGDVIATGTPSGIGKMHPGDVIEIKIEKIGTLKNFVVDHEQGVQPCRS
jgi:2-keto-4-pentenoate hydratase/2-oxohepta-3-ene-1,7-dioic acid hydratase in catechol pathway